MVTVTANGALEVVSVRIDPEALKDADAGDAAVTSYWRPRMRP